MLRVNLGCGDHRLPGYENLDRKNGREIYPLDYPDVSLDEIRASHVLEHFGHREVGAVLANWKSKLKPGGCIKIAVPNFEWIARQYLDNKPVNVQGYVMGGHNDQDDRHGTLFDEEALGEILAETGFTRISRWTDDSQDSSSLECSLNLQAFVPSGEMRPTGDVLAILSAPRHGPTLHHRQASFALGKLGIPYLICLGAYWHQVLAEQMEAALEVPTCKWILTLDYDTIFRAEDVLELYRLAHAWDDVDAVAALQMKRGRPYALFGKKKADGTNETLMAAAQLDRNLIPVTTAHFGLTLFKADSLRKLPRPWFVGKPGKTGRYVDEDRIDPDVQFWLDWADAGMKLYMAPRVPIGHLCEVILWPNRMLEPVYQQLHDFDNDGHPPGVRG